ncbi:septal ring lytic transglycosylase RlpA family protein [Vibrio neptunius]|uniref:Endolytic peptidoglycan transglycosylase RlpA n=1 Tax=Vibrio neptunius TaxID=170651 RepID=A0ABS2ZVU2_9VIBR|nr:septal ring lytic transglycosylase RlpA family protein [Vibrio neptunius]MBN3494538.1 septal ring lytic transglycosylase RlpA family protein [Vibrio neptunius]MBN3513702.1 septal ring lytic transglycosylase RlpA family protein [Vibrio neptunius]MBN3548043.1 septal ring lytic transglycosylase RlpA family protein [Vibrio neptunius]MBN3576370.1 septal ring lytic transglycosylase RlpA family protein [Vibrio neptunius]MCH9870034.1 septal ring lytic transglycosylase RlpA family protein [Vibrio ne
MSVYKLLLGMLCAVTTLVGCSSTPDKRYSIDDDIAPDAPISVEHIEDAHPQYEPYSLGGNSDYTLRGQRYEIIKEPQGFTQEGVASWYGKKFHGHQTSNGEVYDMYSMSAAHKTLPIPSYVKVTNKDNGRSAVVRVNDRGPFHQGRIIDLSFAAATKLDVIRTGTANVTIEVISVDKPTEAHKQKALPKFVVQVASSQHEDKIRTLAQDLSQTLSVKSYISSDKNLHRVFLGPFDDYMLTQKALEQVKLMGYPSAFIKSQ